MSDRELKDLLAGRHKLVARPKGAGSPLRGFLKSPGLVRGRLHLTTVEGQDLAVEVEKLKAVFFVRDFEGDRSYFESKLIETEPERKGLRVRCRFEDNETMEGVAENSLEFLQGAGFFFWPADPGANNRLIYVVKSALLGFKVLGVKD
jgi:hypothetical protein